MPVEVGHFWLQNLHLDVVENAGNVLCPLIIADVICPITRGSVREITPACSPLHLQRNASRDICCYNVVLPQNRCQSVVHMIGAPSYLQLQPESRL